MCLYDNKLYSNCLLGLKIVLVPEMVIIQFLAKVLGHKIRFKYTETGSYTYFKALP